jgi:hypothetical protein
MGWSIGPVGSVRACVGSRAYRRHKQPDWRPPCRCTEAFVTMADAVERSDLDTARRIDRALAPLVAALFAEPSPAS